MARMTSRRGFTLVEVTVVVVILVIMASLIVPRFTGADKRTFKLAVDQVGDLLTMYAQRENLGQKIVGIYHDRGENSLKLMMIDSEAGGLDEYADWREDRFVRPVKLPSFMNESDVTIVADEQRYDAAGETPLTSMIGQQRPTIEITLRGAGESATLVLYPHSVAPVIFGTVENLGTIRSGVDLDTTGHSREDW
ncbi:MAG: prepilin-type N-terminal cleavage/methylation domain-containing protein [Phycisphaerales bacterium]|nr:prepilin-type N-terminal cleavage/methylation domain-containing protein [Phycisphaerales bacterium]MCI0629113.1 prepilin-type N-terminal cleavage/methylation domain-containing protein [Phycisphaerales bacterium]MCI0675191.1 prepilin-type N-terminal cleavage/methylation domain-containing protein [Phycisphaerales bacterium]